MCVLLFECNWFISEHLCKHLHKYKQTINLLTFSVDYCSSVGETVKCYCNGIPTKIQGQMMDSFTPTSNSSVFNYKNHTIIISLNCSVSSSIHSGFCLFLLLLIRSLKNSSGCKELCNEWRKKWNLNPIFL